MKQEMLRDRPKGASQQENTTSVAWVAPGDGQSVPDPEEMEIWMLQNHRLGWGDVRAG